MTMKTKLKLLFLILLLVSLLYLWSTFAQAVAPTTTPATTPTPAVTEDFFDTIYKWFGILLNLIYIVTLPLLTIAGKALDNSLVYGSFIKLDKPLFMLRNISRTFANFAIGGYLLYEIIKYIFTSDNDKNISAIKDIAIKWTGAILGINMSWFLLGALLDISTIAIYSLGALPLSLIGQTQQENMPILSVNTFFDYQSKDSKEGEKVKVNNHIYYKRWSLNISPCGDENNSLVNGMIIWAQYFPDIPSSGSNRPKISFEICKAWETCKRFCALNSQTLADITKLEQRKETNLKDIIDNTTIDPSPNTQKLQATKNIIDKIKGKNCVGDITITGSNNIAKKITQIEIKKLFETLPSYSDESFCGWDIKKTANIYSSQEARKKWFLTPWVAEYEVYGDQDGLSLNKLMDKSKGMVWPFVTLYVSLLDFGNLSYNENDENDLSKAVGGVTEFLIRGIIGILLLVPLITLAVVLIMRIGILWGIIAFTPLGIVAGLLFGDILGKWGGSDFMSKIWNVKNIIWLIFAPIVPVFVLSISIVLIQALHGQMKADLTNQQDARSFLWVQVNYGVWSENTTCADFWGLQELCYQTDDNVRVGSVFVDLFPWLFINIFGIAIMRFLVKASFKASAITAGVAESVMETGGKLISSVPIIPIGKGWTSLSTASQIPGIISGQVDQVSNYFEQESDKKARKIKHNMLKGLNIDDDYTEEDGSDKKKDRSDAGKVYSSFSEKIGENGTINTRKWAISHLSEEIKNEKNEETKKDLTTNIDTKTTELLQKILEDNEDEKKKAKVKDIVTDGLNNIIRTTKDGKWAITTKATATKRKKGELLTEINKKASVLKDKTFEDLRKKIEEIEFEEIKEATTEGEAETTIKKKIVRKDGKFEEVEKK